MIRGIKVLLLMASSVVLQPVYGQVAEPYGEKNVVSRNVRMFARLQIPNVTGNGDPISGTKIELACTSGATSPSYVPTEGEPAWKFVRVATAELTIGGLPVPIPQPPAGWSVAPPLSPLSDAKRVASAARFPETLEEDSKVPELSRESSDGPVEAEIPNIWDPSEVRFSSNFFSHGVAVPITLKLTYELSMVPNPSTPTFVTVTAEISPKPFNRTEGWLTTITASGATWPPAEQKNLADLFNSGQKAYKDAKYSIANSNAVQTKANVQANLPSSTAMITTSHGLSSGIFESNGYEGQNNLATRFLTWPEFKVLTDSQVPELKYASVFVYACSSLAGDLNPMVTFNLRGENAFYVGFSEEIVPWSKNLQDPRSISFAKHIQTITKILGNGGDIESAVTEANTRYRIATSVDFDGGPTPLVLETCEARQIGDPRSTLLWVYLTANERNSLPKSYNKLYKQWYYIYSSQP